jgi:hypothetical protein
MQSKEQEDRTRKPNKKRRKRTFIERRRIGSCDDSFLDSHELCCLECKFIERREVTGEEEMEVRTSNSTSLLSFSNTSILDVDLFAMTKQRMEVQLERNRRRKEGPKKTEEIEFTIKASLSHDICLSLSIPSATRMNFRPLSCFPF